MGQYPTFSPIKSKTVSSAELPNVIGRARYDCDPLCNQAVSLIGGYVDHLHPPPHLGANEYPEVLWQNLQHTRCTHQRGESGVATT